MGEAEPITYHAPAARQPRPVILEQRARVGEFKHLDEIFNSLATAMAIINPERQIVFANDALLEMLGSSLDEVLGARPGEAVHCIHAAEIPAGCGTCQACRYCGAVNTIMLAFNTGRKAEGECRVVTRRAEEEGALDLQVAASPCHVRGEMFLLIELADLSDTKRRRALERIFFHDVINSAGGLEGLLKLLHEPGRAPEKILPLIERSIGQLNREILAQRDLLAAENHELVSQGEIVDGRRILAEVIDEYRHHPLAVEKRLETFPGATDARLTTDQTLLRRILSNLVKNALEATPAGGVVTSGFEISGDSLLFKIHNEAVMPEPVRAQIFQRSFSTKGAHRGLGAYSVKLLAERYLNGKVAFTSEEGKGTTFIVSLPR